MNQSPLDWGPAPTQGQTQAPQPAPQPINPPQQAYQAPPPPQITPEPKSMLDKRVAAQEVYNRLKNTKMLGIIAIAGFILSSGGGAIGGWSVTIIVGGFTIGAMWYLFQAVREMNRLKKEYGCN